MSTKNLARTVIEGGRTQSSKDVRRECIKYTRRQYKSYIRRGLADPEHFDEFADFHYRERDVRSQKDKTNPTERWLDKHVGQPWDQVYSKLKKVFDPRNVAQRHVVYDHMLRSVTDNGVTCEYPLRNYGGTTAPETPYGLYVDADGILRGGSEVTRYGSSQAARRRARRVGPRYTQASILEWADNRRIIVRAPGVYFWAEQAGYTASEHEYFRKWHHWPRGWAYRQTERLCAEEVQAFDDICNLPRYWHTNWYNALIYPFPEVK